MDSIIKFVLDMTIIKDGIVPLSMIILVIVIILIVTIILVKNENKGVRK